MSGNIFLKLGEKVQIRIGKNWYNTIIESLGDESTFYISPPMMRQVQMRLDVGQDYTMSVVNDRGIFEFDVRVLETGIKESNTNVPMTKLLITSEPRHHQRRNAFRTEVIIDVRVREPEDEANPKIIEYQTKTLNLSESGMLFLAKKSYLEGTMLDCDVMLNKYGTNITLQNVKAEVVRTKYPEMDGVLYQIGVDFKELPKQDKRVLVKFIMTSQREQQKR